MSNFKLTKEKCKRALRELKMANNYPTSKYNDSRLIDFHLVTFEQLIEEHFDNQPLKFDELKEGMWVWDNKYKDYVKLKRNNNENVGKIIIFSKGRDEEYLRIFKDNRFYRKEVKDDE